MGYDTLISVVRDGFSNQRKPAEYAGHQFLKGRSSFYRYPHNTKRYLPLGPCGNCAVVSWEAIKRIVDIANSWDVWDPEFATAPENCLDFSVKLALVNACYTIIPDAHLTHKDPSIQKPKDSEESALSNLTRRHLIYYKYLDNLVLQRALLTIESDKSIWKEQGIYVFTRRVKICDMEYFVASARKNAQQLAKKQNEYYKTWRKTMMNSGRVWDIFNLNETL